jgi:hypothetical protein
MVRWQGWPRARAWALGLWPVRLLAQPVPALWEEVPSVRYAGRSADDDDPVGQDLPTRTWGGISRTIIRHNHVIGTRFAD